MRPVRTVTALIAAALALLAVLAPRPAVRKPDIVLIVIDTLRQDHLPFYGYERDTAPFLTALAGRSAVFQNAYSTSSWTAPCTASLFTSLYPVQHGVLSGRMAVRELQKGGVAIKLNRIPHRAETIAEAMKRAGYSTWAVTENSNLSAALGFEQGFDHFFPLNPVQVADAISDRLLALRPQLLSQQPYFLYLHYMDVHAPYNENPPLFDPTLEGDARRVSAYDSEIRYLDSHIESTSAALGWSANTVVVVTSDHGEELRDHGGWGHARTLFAEVLNVPLVVHDPGQKPRRIHERVSHVDVLPTLREIVGLSAAPGDSGLSLLPLIRGASRALPPRSLFADFWHTPEGRPKPYLMATIHGRYKHIEGMPEGEMLFDLDADPMDLQNRIAAYPKVAGDLRGRFERFRAKSRKLEPEFEASVLDQATNEELKALGYIH